MIGEYVVVRTYSAGVHMGTLAELAGKTCVLTDARRLWRWTGAMTLNEVSQDGVGEDSRISKPVPSILLTEAIEVLPCSAKGRASLERSRWS